MYNVYKECNVKKYARFLNVERNARNGKGGGHVQAEVQQPRGVRAPLRGARAHVPGGWVVERRAPRVHPDPGVRRARLRWRRAEPDAGPQNFYLRILK